MELKKMEMKSASGSELNLEALYQIMPSAFTEVRDDKTGEITHKINFNTLRELLGDNAYEGADEEYGFKWVGKNAARREAARAINKTLRPCPEESVDWENTQNLYIEGDNLEVLKLLQKSYLGKVKMIYIDPPYNTGNDFVYVDNFDRSNFEENLANGNVDEFNNCYRKNSDSNARFHSDWCSMIYERLLVARALLANDGAIFISIDENEVENLKKICNEIYGERNAVGTFIWRKKDGGGQAKEAFVIEHEYILVYKKSDSFIWFDKVEARSACEYNKSDDKGVYKITKLAKWGNTARREDRPSMYFPIEAPDKTLVFPIAPDGGDGRWRVGKPRMDEIINNNLIHWEFKNGNWIPYEKEYFANQSKVIKERSILYSLANTGDGSNILTSLFGRKDTFENPKPIDIIKLFAECSTTNDALILDFFSGSATTAHAVMKLNAEDEGNRKFIMVQLPELTDEKSEAYKAGYRNICEIGKERIRRAGKKIKEEFGSKADNFDVGFRLFKCEDSFMNDVYFSPANLKQEDLFSQISNIKDGTSDLSLLFGCMLDWGVQLSLPLSSFEVGDKTIYNVNDGDLVACFAEDINEDIITVIAEIEPLRVVFRDSCFSDAPLKMNLFELFKQKCGWSEEQVKSRVHVI